MKQPLSETKHVYSEAEIQVWLTNQIATQLNVPFGDIDIHQPFDTFGLDSTKAMILMSQAEQLLGYEVSPILLWHYPTIASLSQRLFEASKTAEVEVFEL